MQLPDTVTVRFFSHKHDDVYKKVTHMWARGKASQLISSPHPNNAHVALSIPIGQMNGHSLYLLTAVGIPLTPSRTL